MLGSQKETELKGGGNLHSDSFGGEKERLHYLKTMFTRANRLKKKLTAVKVSCAPDLRGS